MGQIQCCSPVNIHNTENNLHTLQFAQDETQPKIPHEHQIICKSQHLIQTLRQCQNKLKQSSKLFKDNSMKSDPIILSSGDQKHQKIKCTFERPHVFITDPTAPRGKPYKIIDANQHSPSRIVIRDQLLQYFGVFLCFLAKNPNLIDQIILTEPNTYGICALQINTGTKNHHIFIDDYILCCQKQPLFSQPIQGSYMWPCLLQRAWFKLKGNITDKIQKDTPEKVYSSFLSYPIKTYTFSPQHEFENKNLLRNKLYHLEPTMGCLLTSRQQPRHKLGLSGSKFYYLIKVLWFQGKMLYYLRNPCGSFDFRGSLTSVPKSLQTRLLKETGQPRIFQGNFLLDEGEFIEQIEKFSIIYYSKYSSIISEAQLQEFSSQIFIKTYLESDAVVSLAYQQRAGLSQGDPIYAPVTYQVISLTHDVPIGGNNNQEGCFGVPITGLLDQTLMRLREGEYLIRIKKKTSPKGPIIITNQEQTDKIIATAPFPLTFHIDSTDKSLSERFYEFLRIIGKRQLNLEQSKTTRDISQTSYWLGDLAVIYVQKTRQNQQSIKLQICFPQIKNLQCISHKINNEFTALPAFTDNQMIVFQKIDPAEQTVLGKYVIEPF